MTRAKTATLVGGPESAEQISRLRQLLDWPAMRRWGWDPTTEVFTPDPADMVFGFAQCRAVACHQVSVGPPGLCWVCNRVWEASLPAVSFEEFCEAIPAGVTTRGGLCRLCRTPGHERPARKQGFCGACVSAMYTRDQSVAAYLDGDDEFGPAVPRATFGVCGVTACDRWAHRARPALCVSHDQSWHRTGADRRPGAALRSWCDREPPVKGAGDRVAVLRGLPERVQLELLYGLQCRAQAERRTSPLTVRGAANLIRARGATSVFGLPNDLGRSGAAHLLAFTRDRVGLALADPTIEAITDDWDLRVFGRPGGGLQFGQLTQPWLNQAAKLWSLERLHTLQTGGLQRPLSSLGRLSESLRRHREDHGDNPSLLSRSDMAAFTNDLAHLEAAGRVSRSTRRLSLLDVDRFFREGRAVGLSRAAGPLAGLPDDVAVGPNDRVRELADEDEGRALPQVVMDQLLDPIALEQLEGAYEGDIRVAVELQAEVGRRSGELCRLRWECLAFDEVLDEAGRMRPAPVLVHDMTKVGVRNYHLPIGEDAAEIIRVQQARVRARYPNTPTSQLALFPAVLANPRGTKSLRAHHLERRFRTWIDNLARLVGPNDEDFERSDITFYSLRHTYAQHHADSGTPVEVLAALMGHQRLSTTQGYYRVTQKRKRKAVDQLAALQVDRAGERTRPTVQRLLEAEALRDAVGQVAVPFGVCREPTNVKAHGQACPFRHQCFGCTHFHSDPSYLPELRAHLARLLADRERLVTAVPELHDWARNGAIPSAEEIAAVRRVIDRCQDLLAELTDDERGVIDEAIAVLRRTRAQLDTSVPVRLLGSVGQSRPTLFPNVERQQGETNDA
jgi:integrase